MGTGDKERFIEYLKAEDKDGCLDFVTSRLQDNKIDIIELYEQIITPAINELKCSVSEDPDCIWKEHLKTSIVRGVIECCYPYVMKAKKSIKSRGIRVLVLCPENELHEIGARMVTDFFILNGYNAVFIGANTPAEQVKTAIISEKPKYVAISVTDCYNLVTVRKAIELAKAVSGGDVYIMVGGSAFKDNKSLVKQIGADIYLESYEDIKRFGEGDCKHEAGL